MARDENQAEGETQPDEYPLVPPEAQPTRAECSLPPSCHGPSGDPEAPPSEEYQFSLSELLLLVAAVTVILSVIRSIGMFMPGGMTPGAFAGLMGLAAFACMVVLAFVPTPRRIVLVGWWVVLALYLVACAIAVLKG